MGLVFATLSVQAQETRPGMIYCCENVDLDSVIRSLFGHYDWDVRALFQGLVIMTGMILEHCLVIMTGMLLEHCLVIMTGMLLEHCLIIITGHWKN
jgi:hypothetical protein